ncbi:TonB-dependent receptor [Rhizorhabdus dicambivorans]|uniref:TonB-dependent receptor n=1 Tax=Rhizorhabdus dicambivorans TaxID=1850238 RepID=A0A2A4FYW3_9SPHN|nr:TonB-dependent receptor [Rhizorhabdus dicambivorans]ATE67057.1 TonB-dependent receptor [Rhizorhabdus dicambivorans]PCE43400.1 TonB-dependent receptor [Rhizorhabdus dicambivorans]
MSKVRFLFSAAFLGVLSSPALAEDADIVVTGQGLQRSPGDAAYDVISIDRRRLEMSASGRMEDVLRDAAGFQQFRRSDARSAHPTSQGATLRGLGGNASTRALILLDGVPVTDPFGGWVSWAALDPARIGHVRVTRGGGSGVLGAGALAGTIELSSIGPEQAPGLSAGLAYGSRESIDADATLTARLGGGFAMLSAGHARGDGFIPIVAASRGPIDRPARYRQSRAAARAVIPVGADTELQANGSLLLDQRDRGVPFTGNANLAVDASLRLVGRGQWGWEATAWLQHREFSSGFASIGARRATVSQSLDQYNVPANGLGARIELRPPLGEGRTLRIGGDVRHVTGRTEELVIATNIGRIAGGEQSIAGGFAELTLLPVPGLTATASGRIDHWRLRDGRRTEISRTTGALVAANSALYPDRSGTETTGRVGLAWSPLEARAITARAAAYSCWRLPTLNELYRPFRAGNDSTVANPLLNPERVKGIEAGLEYAPLPGWHLGGTVFWNRLDDAISNVTIAANTRQRRNVDAIRSRGIEIDGMATVGEYRMIGSYTHISPRVRASGAALALDGLRPAQTPRDQISVTAEWNRPGVARLGVTGRYVAGQYEDDQNSRRLDGALTFDAVASVVVVRGVSVELRAENIANKRVEATIGADGVVERATPRTLWVALRLQR